MGKDAQDIMRIQEQRMEDEIRVDLQREQEAAPLQQEQPLEQQQEQQAAIQEIQDRLLYNYDLLPANVRAAPGNAPEANLGYKERRKRKNAQKKELKRNLEEYRGIDASQRLLSAGDVRALPIFSTREGRRKWAETKLKHSDKTLRETMEMVQRGDYSNFENLDGVMRNLTAGRALQRLTREYNVMEIAPEELCRQIQRSGPGVSALLDPALRLGLSLAQRTDGFSPEMKERFQKLDEAMSAAVMLETLTHQASAESVAETIREKNPRMPHEQADAAAQSAIEANAAQQIQIAKRLLLLHLGNFQKVNDDGTSQAWDKPVSVALSHCSRVALTLPKLRTRSAEDKTQNQRMWRSIFYQKDGSNPAQDNYRASSTHSIRRREVNGADTKEKKLPFNFIGQRGMNVAIGGLGNAGISGRTLQNDGSCGHFYSMYKEGDTNHYGAMLMGLESDCAGVTNQMGHTHDIKATAEKASSLGGQRTDEVGKKYGGRTCDLSHMSPEMIAGYMEILEDAMKHWQSQPGGLGGEEAAAVMRLLTGAKMSYDDLMRNVLRVADVAAQAYRR